MAEGDAYTLALQNALDEMRNNCPEIQHAIIFNQTGEIAIGDTSTPEKVITRVVDSLNDIVAQAEAIKGIESITLKCEGGTVTLQSFGEHHLVMVTSANADLNYVNNLTRILIPTILKLVKKVCPAPIKTIPSPQVLTSLPETTPEISTVEELTAEKPQEEVKPESLPFEPHAMQLMVEKIGGILARGPLAQSDTVRIDEETLIKWENMFEGKKIEYVEIETFEGKTVKCKVKPIKDSKYFGKGIVQIPEKMRQTLKTKRGELVRVKPIIG